MSFDQAKATEAAGEDVSGRDRYSVSCEIILSAYTPELAKTKVMKTLGHLCRQDPYLAIFVGDAKDSDIDLAEVYAED